MIVSKCGKAFVRVQRNLVAARCKGTSSWAFTKFAGFRTQVDGQRFTADWTIFDKMVNARITACAAMVGMSHSDCVVKALARRKKNKTLSVLKHHDTENYQSLVEVQLPSVSTEGALRLTVAVMPFSLLNTTELFIPLDVPVMNWIASHHPVRSRERVKRNAEHPPTDGCYWHKASNSYMAKNGKNTKYFKPHFASEVSVSAAAEDAKQFRSGLGC
jgi:hypothetical protein